MNVVISYYITVIISIILMWILVTSWGRKKSACYYLLFFTTIIVNLAYLMTSLSSNLDVALEYNRIGCLDGTFMSFFLVLCVFDICNIKLSRRLVGFFVILNVVIFSQIISPHAIYPYFTSAQLVDGGGYSYILRTYGPIRYVYLALVVVYMIAPIVIVAHALNMKKRVSYIYPILLGVAQILTISLYIIEAILNLHIERLPYAYIIVEAVILWIMRRTALYDVGDNVQMVLTDAEEYGYVVLDNKRRFKNCDHVARRYFPELDTLAIDKEINNPFLRHEFGDWILESSKHPVEPKLYVRNGDDVKVTVRPFNDKRGKIIGYLLEIINDSSTQKYIRELVQMSEVQKELRIKADAAAETKSKFLSMMSHEIRTPINAIMGMNEMIFKESSEENIRDYAQDVHGSVEWLLSLVNDILDYSKLESGNMKLVLSDYRMDTILRDILVLATPLAEKKNLKIVTSVSSNIPAIMHGDDTKLRQVLINLVTNAIKYTDEGTITISIDFNDGNLQMSVTDTGRGIPKESIPILFDAYSRVNESENKGIEGTGLGLAITNTFIKLMGGNITVTSEYGKGSTFAVTVPQDVILLKESNNPSANETLTSIDELSIDFENKRVLVVDDTPVNLKLFGLFLKKTDMQVDTAESGVAAVPMCYENKYDLIFVDHMMSNMDGKETTEHIKNDSDSINKDTPIIVATANNVYDGGEEYKSMGFVDYLCKPFTQAKLFELIERHM